MMDQESSEGDTIDLMESSSDDEASADEKRVLDIDKSKSRLQSSGGYSKPRYLTFSDHNQATDLREKVCYKSQKVHSQNGATCHQCRQKTADLKSKCYSPSCRGARGMFCGYCLRQRYGEDVAVVLKDPKWKCPPCRKICNCSICRRRNGKEPTGQLYQFVSGKGYTNVKDYLAEKNDHTLSENRGEEQYIELEPLEDGDEEGLTPTTMKILSSTSRIISLLQSSRICTYHCGNNPPTVYLARAEADRSTTNGVCECCICMDPTRSRYYVLNCCGHIICHECSQRLARDEPAPSRRKCPYCRRGRYRVTELRL